MNRMPEGTSHVLIAAHHWFGDVVGGSFKLASELAEDLAAAGHQVSYLCCGVRGNSRTTVEHGVTVHRYAPPGRLVLRRASYHIAQSRRVAQSIRDKSSVTILNGHSPLQFAGALRAFDPSSVRTVYSVHSPFDDEIATSRRWRIPGLKQVARRAARRIENGNLKVDAVHTISRYTLRTLKNARRSDGSWPDTRSFVLPGWVETSRYRPAADRAAARARLGERWAVDVPVFLTVRRLGRRMGLDTLIDAAAELKQRGHRFQLKIGGSGELAAPLRRWIDEGGLSDRVELLGRVPHEVLPTMYAAADCFVLPTRALECFGLIVLEAFACGTPVIASRAAAIPELAGIQGEEWLFPPGDASALAERMAAFLDGRLQSSADLRGFAEHYDRSVIVPQWTEMLVSAEGRSVDPFADGHELCAG